MQHSIKMESTQSKNEIVISKLSKYFGSKSHTEIISLIESYQLKEVMLIIKECGYKHSYPKSILQWMLKDLYLYYFLSHPIENPYLFDLIKQPNN